MLNLQRNPAPAEAQVAFPKYLAHAQEWVLCGDDGPLQARGQFVFSTAEAAFRAAVAEGFSVDWEVA